MTERTKLQEYIQEVEWLALRDLGHTNTLNYELITERYYNGWFAEETAREQNIHAKRRENEKESS